MKKNNRKGFTIVELVIVIAVIAILAAVLIPTFSGMTEKAEASAITQETRAALTVLLSEKNGQIPDGTYVIYVDGEKEIWFEYDTNEGKLGDAMNETNVEKARAFYGDSDKDEVYARNETSAVFETGTDEDKKPAPATALEDLSKHVEIFING